MRRAVMLLLVLLAIALSACGGGDEGQDAGGGHEMSGHDMNEGGTVLGEAAQPSESDRTVRINAEDKLAFDPASLEVSVGDVVTFVVINNGKAQHEFILGDAAYQEMHADEMSGDHAGMTDSENGITIQPGKQAKLTWRFTEAGEVLYGCHEPGHYAGGMVGTITVG